MLKAWDDTSCEIDKGMAVQCDQMCKAQGSYKCVQKFNVERRSPCTKVKNFEACHLTKLLIYIYIYIYRL